MLDTFNEQRRSVRKNLNVPLKIKVIKNSSLPIQDLLAHSFNISKTGLGLFLTSDVPLNGSDDIKVFIDSNKPFKTYDIPAKLAWRSNERCGLYLVESNLHLEEWLKELSGFSERNQLPSLRNFHSYVGGEDIDTENYDFYPYANKVITDSMAVYNAGLRLRQRELMAHPYFYARLSLADSKLNQKAVSLACQAFQEYSLFSLERRCRIIEDIQTRLTFEKQNLIKLMNVEGLPLKLAEWEYHRMQSVYSKESIGYYQSNLLKKIGQFGSKTMVEVRRPEGVICVSVPEHEPARHSFLASLALLAGNTLVICPPLNAPLSTLYLWRNVIGKALRSNQAPKGTINLLLGNSETFMADWIKNDDVKGILFFEQKSQGFENSKKISIKAKQSIYQVPGNDFLCVWSDARIEQAADALLDGFWGSSQVCMVPKKAMIHEEVYSDFMRVFIKKVKSLEIGLPADPCTILSPVKRIPEFFECLNQTLNQGGTLIIGGVQVNHFGQPSLSGAYILPAVVEIPYQQAHLFQCIKEECYFPLLAVIKVTGEGEPRAKDHEIFRKMTNLLNEHSSRVSMWGNNPYYLRRFIEECQCPFVQINQKHSGFISANNKSSSSYPLIQESNFIWKKSSYLQGITFDSLTERSEFDVL